MGKVEEVKAFKDSNGNVHLTLEEAEKSQYKIDFNEWYNIGSNALYTMKGGVPPEDIHDWILDNWRVIETLIQNHKKFIIK